MNTKTYWNQRVKEYGHTGWSDFATYFYDQNLRLVTIEELIRKYVQLNSTALDYGCGTGDFTQMLAKYYQIVIGVDISDSAISKAINKNTKKNIKFNILNEEVFKDKYDLIMSITVLQHIIEDEDLIRLISHFYSSLSILRSSINPEK